MNKFLLRAAVFAMFFSLLPIDVEAKDSKGVLFHPAVVSQVAKSQVLPIDKLVGNFDNKIELVFSDIDGTIMPHNKENPLADAMPSAKKATIKLREAKIPLILATGRIYPEAKDLAQRIGVKGSYIISQQGSEIRDSKGKLIYQDGIKSCDFKEITVFLEAFKKQNNLDFKIIPAIDGHFYSIEEFELPYIWSKVRRVNSFADFNDNVSPSSICIYEKNPEKIKFIQANLKKRFPAYHIDISTHCFCDVTSATATKGNAIKKMAQLLGVDLKNCVTFGDAENDISMLSQLKSSGGLAVAVGNAMPSVKESANFVTLPVTEGGFAKGIDMILENNQILSK